MTGQKMGSLNTITFFILSVNVVFSLGTVPFDTEDEFLIDTFPEDFTWGVATASYQIEGAWNISGKGESIWDRFSHDGKVLNGDTGDVACDSYNKYEEDIALLAELGVDFYRFSISWSRVLPNGRLETLNEAGIDFYNKVIDGLLAAQITPMVTLYHWDLPQALQDEDGWLNDTIIDLFEDYADLCFKSFGDRVKYWITFNEPFVFTWLGYGIGIHAPGMVDRGSGGYRAGHNVIRSHARAYHRYDKTYRPTQKGKIFITLDSDWKGPRNENSPEDVAAAERAMTFKLGWYGDPIFGENGDYPALMKEIVHNKSMLQGLSESRLPSFTEDEKTLNKGSSDYFGLNHYTTQLIYHEERPLHPPSYESDQDAMEYRDPSWPETGSSWHRVVPWGMRRLLNYIKDRYGNPQVIITENGVSDNNGTLHDGLRVSFYNNYINNVLRAQKLDGCNVISYTAWSLLDNFEWGQGYSEKFGLHYVDFNDPERPRRVKNSARFFAKLITDNGFVNGCGRLTTRFTHVYNVLVLLFVAIFMIG